MKKTSHTLHLCKTSNDFIKELQNNNINLQQIINKYLKKESQPGILLVGSLAEGNANEASDLDIKVLIDDESDFIFDKKDVNIKFDNRKEILIYINGIEINLIFYFSNFR